MTDGDQFEPDVTVDMPYPGAPTVGGGRYQFRQMLGEGGQKRVFLARDMRLDRDVVISLLKTESPAADQVGRFWREAKALAQLGDHSNIVTVFDVGEEASTLYLVCQYVQAGSVAHLLNREQGHRLPLIETMNIAQQVCRALERAHGAGIVHRDIKPSNIWLAQDGTVKLGDFGLALRMDGSQQSMTGSIVGTAPYLSPEQAEGEPATPRSDLYSVGVLLYEMSTGRPPFLGDNLAGVIWQHINTPPVAPSWHNPDISPALENLILRLLAKSPADRPPSAAAVREALASIAGSDDAMAERVVRPARSLDRLAAGVFVGREHELRQLRGLLNDAKAGRGRIAMLVGEPGCGKTQTAERLAAYARLHGACVLSGRCHRDEGAPAFWPWVQMIREYALAVPGAQLSVQMGAGATAIAEIVPEVHQRVSGLVAPPPLEPAQARFRLFDSVTQFLKNASQAKTLVLVIDDLHWADRASLLLLEFLGRDLPPAKIMVLATYRDIEVGRQHPLSQTLADLAHPGLADRIPLGGLSEQEVTKFIEISTGFSPPAPLVSSVFSRTEGNPFFVNEVVKLLVSEGRLTVAGGAEPVNIQLPQGVKDVIGRRLNHLSDDSNRVLAIASAIGREFTAQVLERVGEISGERLVELLDEAVLARVVKESAPVPGDYSFSHALIRDVLYEELGPNRRVRLHRKISDVLEKVFETSIDEHLPELAHHSLQGAAGGDIDKAISYAVRAAERATALLSYEEAATYYERALEVLELQRNLDKRRRCEFLLGVGDAHKRAGDSAKARAAFEKAADVARRIGAPELLALAAVGLSVVVIGALGVIDQLQINLLTEALGVLPKEDSPLRARVLAHLSAALYYSPDKREPLSLESVEMARRVGDPVALITALYCRHVALVLTEDLGQRHAAALEMLEASRSAGLKEMELRAWYRLIVDAMELGDIKALDEAIDSYSRLANDLRQPAYLWLVPFFQASRALLKADFPECERLGKEALVIAQRVQSVTALLFVGVQLSIMRVEQGRAEEQLEPTLQNVKQYPMIPGNRAILAYIYSHLERSGEARRALEEVIANDFAALPRDGSWIVVLSALSYVCWFLRDAATAGKIYPLLLPYCGRNIVSGNSGVGIGSVSRPLGLLAGAMSRWDEAVRHLEAAIAANDHICARSSAAWCRLDLGQVLLLRREPGDSKRAKELLDVAAVAAEDLGMRGLEAKIRRSKLAAPASAVPS
jgi:eukaryotic-like serine/threonine-protein kinase